MFSRMSVKTGFIGISGLIGLLAIWGCAPKSPKAIKVELPKQEVQVEEEKVPSLDIGAEWTQIPQLGTAYFDYDKYNLRDDARGVLKKNIPVLKALPTGVQILIEGHCDERGTIEYNLALGERRANAVKNYYGATGIPNRAMSTVSYGEEKLVCTDQDESCWTQNRRGVSKVRASDEAVSIPLDKLPK